MKLFSTLELTYHTCAAHWKHLFKAKMAEWLISRKYRAEIEIQHIFKEAGTNFFSMQEKTLPINL